MSKLSKVDTAIKIVEFNLKSRKERVDQISKKLEPTPKEKVFVGQEIELINNVEVLIKSITDKFNGALGKIPPMAPDLEEAILGAVLLEKDALNIITRFLLPEHLSNASLQIIYETILEMKVDHKPIDVRTVVIELQRKGKLESVGGAFTVADITSRVNSAANIEYHGRVVIEMAMLRRLISLGSDLIRMGNDMKDAFEVLHFAEDEISIINFWIETDQHQFTQKNPYLEMSLSLQ